MNADQSPVFENLESLVRFNDDGIYTRVLVKTEEFSSALICLGEGKTIEPHFSTGQCCLHVIEGAGRIVLPDREVAVGPGSFVFIPPRLQHSISAQQNLSAVLCLNHMITPELYRLRRERSAASEGAR